MNNSPGLSPAQFNFADTAQWKVAINQALIDLRCSIPAIVQSVDYTNNPPTVTVQVAIKEIVKTATGPVVTTIYPIATVPIILPSAGGFSLTLPIAEGDEGLLIFCDACIDLWWTRGGVQEQLERRRHDISDCGFVPGMRSQMRPGIPNWSQNTAQLRTDDGTAYVELTKGGAINIVAPGGITLTGPLVVENAATFEETAEVEGALIADAGIQVGSGAAITGDGGTLTIDGAVEATGEGTFSGIPVSTHVHGGVTTGGGATGLPVP